MTKEPYDLMDLKALRCFEAMARHGSLTKASIELDISDAAVSQRIKSLEKHLGAKLYESRGGKVRLTEAGQRTKDMAMRLFDELTEFEEAIGDESSGGTVVLSAEVPLLRYQLPDIVDSYSRDHANARLRLLGRTATESVEMVRRNEADLGIVNADRCRRESNFTLGESLNPMCWCRADILSRATNFRRCKTCCKKKYCCAIL